MTTDTAFRILPQHSSITKKHQQDAFVPQSKAKPSLELYLSRFFWTLGLDIASVYYRKAYNAFLTEPLGVWVICLMHTVFPLLIRTQRALLFNYTFLCISRRQAERALSRALRLTSAIAHLSHRRRFAISPEIAGRGQKHRTLCSRAR